MKVFILCAGNQERFGNFSIPKQLLNINGEPLLHRTVRQVYQHGQTIFIISNNKKLQIQDCHFIVPSSRKTTCHTIQSILPLTDEKTIILLGDVYYTDTAIKVIFNCEKDFQFFTDTGDFFAICFTENYKEMFSKQIKDTLIRWANDNLWTCPILELYRTMGVPEHLCTFIADETQDFDRYHEYEDFLKGKSKNRLFNENN
jgi:hypothetical protein